MSYKLSEIKGKDYSIHCKTKEEAEAVKKIIANTCTWKSDLGCCCLLVDGDFVSSLEYSRKNRKLITAEEFLRDNQEFKMGDYVEVTGSYLTGERGVITRLCGKEEFSPGYWMVDFPDGRYVSFPGENLKHIENCKEFQVGDVVECIEGTNYVSKGARGIITEYDTGVIKAVWTDNKQVSNKFNLGLFIEKKNVKLISKTKQNEVQSKIKSESGVTGQTAVRRSKSVSTIATAGRLVGNPAKAKVSKTRIGKFEVKVSAVSY